MSLNSNNGGDGVVHGTLTIEFMIVSKFSSQKFVGGQGHSESVIGFC